MFVDYKTLVDLFDGGRHATPMNFGVLGILENDVTESLVESNYITYAPHGIYYDSNPEFGNALIPTEGYYLTENVLELCLDDVINCLAEDEIEVR